MHFKDQEIDLAFLAEVDQALAAEHRPNKAEAEERALEMWGITGRPKAECAFKQGINLSDRGWWEQPADIFDDSMRGSIDLIGDYKNPIVDMARAVAEAVQFPVNTTFLHGLGVISSTTIKNFHYVGRYGAKKHMGLYTVAAQPPSSGKSPTNDILTSPITRRINESNQKNEPLAMVLKIAIDALEIEIKKKTTPPGEKKIIAEEIIKKRDELLMVSPYTWGVTDTTPEALEDCAAKQFGRFAIVSDEAEAVTVVFGVNYGDAPPNLGFMLKGFDGGQQLTLRMGRQGYRGEVFGSVAVLAQESTVKAILETGRVGKGSRGVCERFLILNEPNIIHQKDHRKHTPIPRKISDTYNDMVAAIVNNQFETGITFSADATEYIIQVLERLQKHISDGGKFANELMRGVVGKAETQICKIASTLHVAKEWAPNGNRSTECQASEVAAASNIYIQLIRCFVSEAENEGIAGEMLEMRIAAKRLKYIINDSKKPRVIIKYSDLSDSLKNTLPFSQIRGLRKHVKESLLPNLQKNGFIVFDEKEGVIHINPHLKE